MKVEVGSRNLAWTRSNSNRRVHIHLWLSVLRPSWNLMRAATANIVPEEATNTKAENESKFHERNEDRKHILLQTVSGKWE
jgi:hypothetical protein